MHRVIVATMAGLIFSSFGAPQSPENKLPDGEGKEVTERVCGAYYAIDTVVSERHNKTESQKVSGEMVARGADAMDAEVKTIVEYLTKYFGRKATEVK